MKKRTNALLGAVGIAMAVAIAVYALSGIGGHASSPFEVTATFDRVGQLLRVAGDVKLRGVLIGKVSKITHLDDGRARVVLALNPGVHVPENVAATVSAKTLFGEKFVQLLDPAHPSAAPLRAGDQIPQDRTTAPFELEQVIQALVPLLDETKPGDLGGMLHALAQGLAGQEDEARDSIAKGLIALKTLADHRADLDRLLAGMPRSSQTLADVSPDLAASLDSLDRLSKTLNADASDLTAALRDTPTVLDQVASIVKARYTDLVDIAVKGADVLDVIASHKGSLPGTVASLKTFTQDWDQNLAIPCTNLAGDRIEQIQPSLKGTTCWQLWVVAAEANKTPGGYGTEGPQPPPASAAVTTAAYRAQMRQLLGLPFGVEPTGVDLLLGRALAGSDGLLPGGLL